MIISKLQDSSNKNPEIFNIPFVSTRVKQATAENKASKIDFVSLSVINKTLFKKLL